MLFENVMSLHRLKAAFTGLLEAERVNEWIVTEKLGDANKINKPIVIDIMEDDKLIDSQLTEPCIPKLKKFKSRLSDRYYDLLLHPLWYFYQYYFLELKFLYSSILSQLFDVNLWLMFYL